MKLSDMGMRPSTVHLPAGNWQSVYDCLCELFPAITAEIWQQRFLAGKVLNEQGYPLALSTPYQPALKVHYFREVENEPVIPFEAHILYQDDHLLVVDKPHFLPVMPSGRFVRQTLLARLILQLGNADLVPIHRIDRLTAGLVLFSVNPATRGQYQALFRERRVDKYYEAIAPALAHLQFPYTHRSRMVAGEPFFRMQEVPGEANSETLIEVLDRSGSLWRYGLSPVTGKKHQLRVHLAGLEAAIVNDDFYPALTSQEDQVDSHERPLQLLARRLRFIDPVSREPLTFESQLRLGS